MSLIVECESCQAKNRIPAEVLGKRIRCKTCGTTFSADVAAPTPPSPPIAPKPGAPKPVAARPAVVTPPVIPPPVPAPVKPPPPPPVEVDEVEELVEDPPPKKTKVAAVEVDKVEEVVEAPPPRKKKKAGKTAGGEELFDEHEVPEDYRELFRDEREDGEQISWVGRPRQDILVARANRVRLISAAVLVGIVILMPMIAFLLFTRGETFASIAGGVVLFLMLIFMAATIAGILYPIRVKRGASHRPCYILTDRRVLLIGASGGISFGTGGGVRSKIASREEAKKQLEKAGKKVQVYEPTDLLGMHRRLDPKYPGAGELYFERNVLDNSEGFRMEAIDDVEAVEKRIREELLHPAIARLLRGELSQWDFSTERTARKPMDNAVVQDLRSNLGNRDDEPETLESLRKILKKSLKEAEDDELERVNRELTEGEELLWVGRPETKAKGQGLVVHLMGAADNMEPPYFLYALTNRRVLLWADESRTGDSPLDGKDPICPMSYYSTMLKNIRSEDDDRLEDGGSLIFKMVRLTVTTESTSGDSYGNRNTSTRNEIHRFGIMRIHNSDDVGDAIYYFLVRPLRKS